MFPRTSWKPFFLGIGDALNVAPRTNYHRVRIDPGRAWGMVGRDIFDAAECIGTLRDTSRHVVDLILTDGGRTRTRCIGRVFEYRHPIPGSMDRIITMAERQAKHNQSMDRLAIWLTFAERFIGQLFGLTIGLAAIGGGVYVMLQGTGAWSYIAGTILGGSGLASLVGVFVYGRKVAQQTEDDE